MNLDSCDLDGFFGSNACNSSLDLPADEEITKQLQPHSRIIDEFLKKMWKFKSEKSERIVKIFCLDLEKWLVVKQYSYNYLYIPLLNPKLIKIKQMAKISVNVQFFKCGQNALG